jgi:small GTP-binding protein
VETRKISKKICLLGDPAVGKTSLIARYVHDIFGDEYLSTVGAKITKKATVVELPKKDIQVKLNLLVWDIAGQNMFKDVHATYYIGAEGALVVADLSRKNTIDNIGNWLSEFHKVVSKKVPVMVLGNKYDLKEEGEELDEKRLDHEAGTHNAPFLLTSAKTGENVEQAFQTMAEVLAKQALKDEKW